MKKKKKFKMAYVYIALILALFVLIGVLNNSGPVNALYDKKTNDLNPATRELLDDPNYQNIILPAELDKKVADKEDFFVYFFASDCGYCRQTTPELIPLAKEMGLDLPMFNLREFEPYFNKYNINYTPTLAYFKDGVEIARLEGGLAAEGTSGYSIDDFKNFLTTHSGADAQ